MEPKEATLTIHFVGPPHTPTKSEVHLTFTDDSNVRSIIIAACNNQLPQNTNVDTIEISYAADGEYRALPVFKRATAAHMGWT